MTDRIEKTIKTLTPIKSKLKAEMSIKTDLGIDSLRIVELIVALEEEFSIQFDLSDLNTSFLLTVGDLFKLVKKYVL